MNKPGNVNIVAYEQFIKSDTEVKKEFAEWLKLKIAHNASLFSQSEKLGQVSIGMLLAREQTLEEVLEWFTKVFISGERNGR